MKIQKIKENYKSLIYVVLIAVVLTYTFIYAIQKGMHQTLPEAIGRHVKCVGIAISELQYGLKDYCGYNKVLSVLTNNGITNDAEILKRLGERKDEVLRKPCVLNNALKQAANIKDAASSGRYYLFREDKGLVTYYKLAFRIFGYKIESFFYLYFLLLIVSIVIFLITFYGRNELLNILLLFVCSHFVVVAAAPIVGIELQTVHNARFLSVLAILPAIYLALVILGKHRFTKKVLLCTFIQAAILIFVIHTRTSTTYQIMFLSMAFGLAALWFWINNPQIRKYVFNKIYFWPLAIIFIGIFLLKIHLALCLHYPYTPATERHKFWHPVYLGLAAHPDSMSKYGIKGSDTIAVDVVIRRLIEWYGTEVSFEVGLLESILKEEFFKIFKKDPRFVIESYLYKFPLFIKNYFSFFGAIRYLFRWPIMMIIIVGGLLGGRLFLKSWSLYFYLFVLGLIFSLLPSILLIPYPHLIADPALLFTMVIYMIVVGIVCYIISKGTAIFGLKNKGEIL